MKMMVSEVEPRNEERESGEKVSRITTMYTL